MIEQAGFRVETTKSNQTQLNKAPFQLKTNNIKVSNWTRQSKKWRFPTQLVSRIRASKRLESPAAYWYEYHPPTHTTTRHANTTPNDNIGDAGLAAITSAAARLESVWYILIYFRQQHVTAPDGRSVRCR